MRIRGQAAFDRFSAVSTPWFDPASAGGDPSAGGDAPVSGESAVGGVEDAC
jgi:hypothetical protein